MQHTTDFMEDVEETSCNNAVSIEASEQFVAVYIPADDSEPLRELTLPKDPEHLDRVKTLLQADNLLWCRPKKNKKRHDRDPFLLMDKDWITKSLPPNKRASVVYENQRDEKLLILCGPAVYLQTYYVDEDEITGEPIEGRSVFLDQTVETFEWHYEAALKRMEARDSRDDALLDELIATAKNEPRVSQKVVTDAAASLPLTYDEFWPAKTKSPLALLNEYAQKRGWKNNRCPSYSGPSGGPFLVTLSIPDLQLKFTPKDPSKQKKTAEQQAALLALHHLHGSRNLEGTIEKITPVGEDVVTGDDSEWIPVTEDRKITKKIIQEGIGEVVADNAGVTVEYTGKMLTAEDRSGKVFTPPQSACYFTIGDGTVLKGLDLAVRTMRQQERALFAISYEYGFGPLGAYPAIPGKADLLFDVKLVGTGPKIDMQYDPMVRALKEKEDGNRNFQVEKEYQKALKCYNRGISILQAGQGDEEETEQENNPARAELLNALCLNSARAALRVRKFPLAEARIKEVLARSPGTFKALYVQAQLVIELGRYDEAEKALAHLRGVALAGERRGVEDLAKDLRERKRKENMETRRLYQKMF